MPEVQQTDRCPKLQLQFRAFAVWRRKHTDEEKDFQFSFGVCYNKQNWEVAQ